MTNPTDVAHMETGGDPVLETIKWLGVSIAGIMAFGGPLLLFARRLSANRAANSKDAAESVLYANLSEQLLSQKKQLDEITAAHNALVLEHAKTLARVSKVEEYEATIQKLNIKLAQRENSLAEKDAELRAERDHNRKLTMEVISLKDRIASLERHLLSGEDRNLRLQLAAADTLDVVMQTHTGGGNG